MCVGKPLSRVAAQSVHAAGAMTSNLFQRRRTFVIQQGATPLACSITARVRTVVELRRTHMPGYEIARRIGASPASVSRILRRALLTDNGSSYRSGLFRLACQQMQLKPRHPRPYTPRTNDKAELHPDRPARMGLRSTLDGLRATRWSSTSTRGQRSSRSRKLAVVIGTNANDNGDPLRVAVVVDVAMRLAASSQSLPSTRW